MSATPCKARRSDGEPCRAYPIKGAVVCRVHGGSTKQVKAAARRRLARQQLEGDLGRLLGELESDAGEAHPVEALLDALRRTWAMTNFLRSMVGGLGTDALYGPTTSATPDRTC